MAVRRISLIVPFLLLAGILGGSWAQASAYRNDGVVVVALEGGEVFASSAGLGPEMYQEDEYEEEGDGELSEADRKAYAAQLRANIEALREGVVGKITDKLQAKQGSRLGTVALVLFAFSLCGILLLFAPVALRRKYPGQTWRHLKYGALSALLFFMAVNLFSGILLVMRGSQAVLGTVSNPQVRMVDAGFDLLHAKAPEMAEFGPMLIDPVLAEMNGETETPMLALMLENVQQLQEDVKVFSSVATLFKKLDGLMGMIPLILVGIALLLFAQAARSTLVEIVHLPSRAASGEKKAARSAVRTTLRQVLQEFKATIGLIVVLSVLTVIGGMVLAHILVPTLEVFLAYFAISFLYIMSVPDASSVLVFCSLMAAIIFLLLNLAISVVSVAVYASKSHKLFQLRFRQGIPLSASRQFWTLGLVSVLWCQLLPLLFAMVSVPVVGWLATKLVDAGNWPLTLLGGAGLFLISFLLVFWAARGDKAFQFLLRYNVKLVVVCDPEETQELPQPMEGLEGSAEERNMGELEPAVRPKKSRTMPPPIPPQR